MSTLIAAAWFKFSLPKLCVLHRLHSFQLPKFQPPSFVFYIVYTPPALQLLASSGSSTRSFKNCIVPQMSCFWFSSFSRNSVLWLLRLIRKYFAIREIFGPQCQAACWPYFHPIDTSSFNFDTVNSVRKSESSLTRGRSDFTFSFMLSLKSAVVSACPIISAFLCFILAGLELRYTLLHVCLTQTLRCSFPSVFLCLSRKKRLILRERFVFECWDPL